MATYEHGDKTEQHGNTRKTRKDPNDTTIDAHPSHALDDLTDDSQDQEGEDADGNGDEVGHYRGAAATRVAA